MDYCQYRLPIQNSPHCYCRHPRVHVYHQLVTEDICRRCSRNNDNSFPMRPPPEPKWLASLGRGPLGTPAPHVAIGDSIPRIDTPPQLHRDDILLAVAHFNPMRYENLRQTYYDWLPTLGPHQRFVKVYELVFDDDEPEMDGSVVIRGTRAKSLMWQKEALLNRALRDAPPTVKYFAWLDHDSIFENPYWLHEGIAKISEDNHAVQLFSSRIELDANQKAWIKHHGRAANPSRGNPGSAWIADRKWLDSIGGLFANGIVGGGDQIFFSAVAGNTVCSLSMFSKHLKHAGRRYIAQVRQTTARCDFVDGTIFHLYHGPTSTRQFRTRQEILNRHAYDPYNDTWINGDGILEWCSDKLQLRDEVLAFFENRKDRAQ